MNDLISFDFHDHPVRIVTDAQGAPWFVAKDVTDVLGYRDAANGLRSVPPSHIGTHSVSTHGGPQNMLCVDEPGLYRLVLRSNKPEAEPFMEWVTAEVLPAIRKTGGYQHPGKDEVEDLKRRNAAAAAHLPRAEYLRYLEGALGLPPAPNATDQERPAKGPTSTCFTPSIGSNTAPLAPEPADMEVITAIQDYLRESPCCWTRTDIEGMASRAAGPFHCGPHRMRRIINWAVELGYLTKGASCGSAVLGVGREVSNG